ncbi:hypothetical protein BJF93_11840 [Xaviernesmea oryzae]|uniref:AB hydrolase-1 domain-containing protein n=1 Tax=Xaviernesmea oryzae TaxID=464029 RepID=A0A1Q9AVC3_9HYPH|nr:alpha/beta fold hydrolase [Xaviernesmea oryzae]OLP59407.1 hypothetical protein BJF93_11840 [Xaviernesmea oryzae]SEL61251.1 Pimeloyl-ACP methyl ester carboxylesterase [Xaviernesmea oryzae]
MVSRWRLGALVTALVLFSYWAFAMPAPRWRSFTPPPPLPHADESGYAAVNGIHMYYAIFGKGRGDPVLLIHGGMGSGDAWGFEVPELAKTHEVIVADSRGHGRSTRLRMRYTYDLMAKDYIALLDQLGIDKVALVGFSDGGIIGLDIAIHHPERLTKLFAQAANASPQGLFDYGGSDGLAAKDDDPDDADDFHAFKAAIETMWRTEPNFTQAQLASIPVPTEIVVGDHDEFIRPEHSRYLAETIPGAKLVILRNVSHLALAQDPAQYLHAIRNFIGS